MHVIIVVCIYKGCEPKPDNRTVNRLFTKFQLTGYNLGNWLTVL